jgi:hypothetical protein
LQDLKQQKSSGSLSPETQAKGVDLSPAEQQLAALKNQSASQE